MINIKEVLLSFTDEYQQEFISFLNKKNKRKDAKNTQLVQLLLADYYSTEEISTIIYGKQNKVALHALRKRLLTSLIDFTANVSMKKENSLDIKLIKYILSARSFLQKGQIKIGYHILDKAATIAKEYQLFSILNEIYHTIIEYAHQNENLDFDETQQFFKENQQQLILEDNLNIVYAKIRKSLVEYEQQKAVIDIKKLIKSHLEKQQISNLEVLSFKSLYQLIKITTISSAQKFDYYNIESFVVETYEIIKNHKSKDKQLYYHLEILYLTANILFRNKKFIDSMKYLELMRIYMSENNQKYVKEFLPKHDLLLGLNLNYTNNQHKAIALFEDYVDKKEVDLVAQLDIYLSLIVFYFQQKSLESSRKIMSKFYHTDKWYLEKAGLIWTIKKNLIDILLQIELGNIDLAESRLQSFKRNYFKHLKEIQQERVITYLNLIEIYFKNPEKVTTTAFYNKVENAFNWIDIEKEDVFLISFFAWLKAKMTKQDVYLVTLQMITI